MRIFKNRKQRRSLAACERGHLDEDEMETATQDNAEYVSEHDLAWLSVSGPMYIGLDDVPIPSPALNAYVESKLDAIAPWLVHSSAHQSAFDEAYQLCQSGYDFNLIVYEPPAGHYIMNYEPIASATRHRWHARHKNRLGWYWQRILKLVRWHIPRPKYDGEIIMAKGRHKWVEDDPGRFIVVPEGILKLC